MKTELEPPTAVTSWWQGRLGRLRTEVAGGLGEALWLFVTLRIAYSLFALMASYLFRLGAQCSPQDGVVVHTTGLAYRLLGVWQHWDACWYQKIATYGYRPGDPSVAFFPLYPLLMHGVSVPLAGNLTLSGLVVSGVAYIAAMTGLYRLVRRDFGEQVARRTMLYLSVFPSAFFLFAPFTEALFLALAVWSLYLARSGAWSRAWLPALLVGLTRMQGGFLALPLAWEAIRQWRHPKDAKHRSLSSLLVPLLPLYGLLMFISYSKVFTGWTTFQAIRVWGRTTRTPWAAIAISWQHARSRGDVIEALNLVSLVLFTVLLMIGLRRLPLSYMLYAAPQLILIATRQNFFSPLMSTTRYVLVLFPAFVVLALLARRRLHYSWLIVSLLLLGFLLYAFLSGSFVA